MWLYNTVNGKRYEGESVNFKEGIITTMRIMNNENAKSTITICIALCANTELKISEFYFRRIVHICRIGEIKHH